MYLHEEDPRCRRASSSAVCAQAHLQPHLYNSCSTLPLGHQHLDTMAVTDTIKDALPETVKETVGLQSSGGPSTRTFKPIAASHATIQCDLEGH